MSGKRKIFEGNGCLKRPDNVEEWETSAENLKVPTGKNERKKAPKAREPSPEESESDRNEESGTYVEILDCIDV